MSAGSGNDAQILENEHSVIVTREQQIGQKKFYLGHGGGSDVARFSFQKGEGSERSF